MTNNDVQKEVKLSVLSFISEYLLQKVKREETTNLLNKGTLRMREARERMEQRMKNIKA
jgi:hypothetical protein